MKCVISSGHGLYIRGASGNPVPPYLDEVNEARLVVEQAATELRRMGIDVTTYHDNISDDQNENLNRIVDFHNSKTRDLDVSVHFNWAEFNGSDHTSNPVGCEVLYVSDIGAAIAEDVVTRICIASGLKNRGPKFNGNLFFLNNTEEPAILIETCFCNSLADADIYRAKFTEICSAIAAGIADEDIAPGPTPPEPTDVLLEVSGTCSWFGGPDDTGVSPSEGLAFLYEVSDAPDLFLPTQPPATSGLARRLDPETFYVACRWDYAVTPKEMLRDQSLQALVRANDKEFLARPADWGPHEDTGRVADLSPGLMEALGILTDERVEVIYPAPDDIRPPEPIPEPDVPTVSIQIAATGPVRVIVNGTSIEDFE